MCEVDCGFLSVDISSSLINHVFVFRMFLCVGENALTLHIHLFKSTVVCVLIFIFMEHRVCEFFPEQDVTQKRFGSKTFRVALEDGVLLCE